MIFVPPLNVDFSNRDRINRRDGIISALSSCAWNRAGDFKFFLLVKIVNKNKLPKSMFRFTSVFLLLFINLATLRNHSIIELRVFRTVNLSKKTPTQVFSCEYCEIFKNTYLEGHLPTAASELLTDERR